MDKKTIIVGGRRGGRSTRLLLAAVEEILKTGSPALLCGSQGLKLLAKDIFSKKILSQMVFVAPEARTEALAGRAYSIFAMDGYGCQFEQEIVKWQPDIKIVCTDEGEEVK